MLIFLLFLCQFTYATTIEVIGPLKTIIPQESVQVNLEDSLGKISVNFFNQKNLSYVGNEAGIVSIQEDGNWIEIISDTEMKAYGWCFSLNGKVLETMSDQTFLVSQNDHIRWFYAYAHYKDGYWIAQCHPVFHPNY